MRILMVAESSTVHTHRWAQFFSTRGNEVLVVSQSACPIEGIEVIEYPPSSSWWSRLPRRRFGGGWLRWIAGWPRWKGILRKFRPDIVHVHYLSAQARDYFYYRGRFRLIVSSYGSDVVFSDSSPRPETRRRLRSLLRQADEITSTSRFLEEATRRWTPRLRPIHVIPFGVDCEVFRPRQDNTDDNGPLVIGFIKHLEEKYGPRVLIEAFARVCEELQDKVRLVLAGTGSLDSDLRLQARAMDLDQRIDFIGRVAHEKVPALLQEIDIAAMPSLVSESFGVAAIEASACEIPVVASNVGGVPEAVIHGKTGILVQPNDAKALADALLLLARNDELRQTLGRGGRKFVLEQYQWEENAQRMIDVFSNGTR